MCGRRPDLLLGLSVLVTTAYRVLVLNQPKADLMGVFRLVALAVNLAAALVLLPHRHGDTNIDTGGEFPGHTIRRSGRLT